MKIDVVFVHNLQKYLPQSSPDISNNAAVSLQDRSINL